MSKRAAALDELTREAPSAVRSTQADDPLKHLTIRVRASLRAKARAVAATEQRSVQDIVTELLTDYVSKRA